MPRSISLNRDKATAFAVILFFCFFANYYDFFHFGFYEDDYTTITPYLNMPMNKVFNIWSVLIERTFERGRPLGNLIPSIAAITGFKLAGIPGIHLFGFIIVFINGLLVYKIVERRFEESLALFAGIIFVLYPAITVKQYLTHTLQLQSSLLIGLAAVYLYINGRKKTSYVLATLCLFTYELGFLPYLFSPLFINDKAPKTRISQLVIHVAYCGVILMMVAGARIYAGDYRFSNPYYIDSTAVINEGSLIKFFKALFIGPWISLKSFIRAVSRVWIWAPRNLSILLFGVTGAIIGFFIAIKTQVKINERIEYWNETVALRIPLHGGEYHIKGIHLHIIIAILTGMVCLSGAYLFNLPKYPPDFLSTRNVSEHLASMFGGSLFVASIIIFVLYTTACKGTRIYQRITRYTGCLLVAIVLGFLVAFGRYLQIDAINVWNVQKAFWTQFNVLVPDLEKGTRVYLYKNHSTPFALNLQPFSWSMSLVAEQLYTMRKDWGETGPIWYKSNSESEALYTGDKIDNFPRVLFINHNWWKSVSIEDDLISPNLGKDKWFSRIYNFKDGNLIVLEFRNGHLERRYKDIISKNGVIHLKNPMAMIRLKDWLQVLCINI